MRTICFVLCLVAASLAHAGVLKTAARGAALAGKKAAYPVRHPRKSAHGLAKAGKRVAKVVI